MDRFVKTLISAAKELNIDFTQEQLEKFSIYYKKLVEFNKKMNLTSITDPKEAAVKHFIDSLTCLDFIKIDGKCSIMDVGTGAGFPGVVLSIYNNDFEVTLLDSLQKRIFFLKDLTQTLHLNMNIIHDRAENIGKNKNYREKYDIVISRAVAEMVILSEYCIPLVKHGGIFIALKGPKGLDELKKAEYAVEKLGGTTDEIKHIKLPFTDDNRVLIKTKKTKQTPKQFPRKAGIPAKRPLIK